MVCTLIPIGRFMTTMNKAKLQNAIVVESGEQNRVNKTKRR